MSIVYSSNNSGGSWWLSAKQWEALEAAGWKITDHSFDGAPCEAVRHGVTRSEAIAEWVDITGQDPNALGCPCCGRPHSFYEVGDGQ